MNMFFWLHSPCFHGLSDMYCFVSSPMDVHSEDQMTRPSWNTIGEQLIEGQDTCEIM